MKIAHCQRRIIFKEIWILSCQKKKIDTFILLFFFLGWGGDTFILDLQNLMHLIFNVTFVL